MCALDRVNLLFLPSLGNSTMSDNKMPAMGNPISRWSIAAVALLSACAPQVQIAPYTSYAPADRADWLYCDLQGQIAASNTRGIIYPAAVYAQIRQSCLEMKAAEREAQAEKQ
jgi:hypothetical protein